MALAGAAITFLLRSAVIAVFADPDLTGAVKALFAGKSVDKPQALAFAGTGLSLLLIASIVIFVLVPMWKKIRQAIPAAPQPYVLGPRLSVAGFWAGLVVGWLLAG